MRSIRTRLVLVTLLVALAAVATTAWITNRETSRELRGAVEEDLRNESEIYEALSFHAYTTGTWDGVGGLVVELANDYDERIALTDTEGMVIADSAALMGDDTVALPDTPVGFIDPGSSVIQFEPATEAPFLTGLEDLIIEGEALAGWLEDAGVEFSFEEDPFGIGYPVWDETDPFAQAVADWFFRDFLTDFDPAMIPEGAGEILGFLSAQAFDLGDFLNEAGVPHDIVEGPLGVAFVEWDVFDPEANEAVAEFYDRDGPDIAFSLEDVLPVGIPDEPASPALLFLGLPDETSVLPAGAGWRLLGAVAVLALAAIAITLFASRRMLKPIGELTGAAQRLEAGELSERVDVRGGDEVAVLASAFNSMAASLEEEDELRRALTSDIAHELRTPLSNIRGYLEAIREGVTEPDPAVIASIHEEAIHLQRLIDDLQELSLAETGRLAINRTATDLGGLLEQIVGGHGPAAEAAGVELTHSAPHSVTLEVDAGRVRQVVANLVDNAIRHTPRGGRVEVSLASEPEWAVITVTDTGSGIPSDHLPHVFERLYRADPSRTRATGGSGLGLAIARELVRAHGGEISVESTLGEGSTFSVRLPGSRSQ